MSAVGTIGLGIQLASGLVQASSSMQSVAGQTRASKQGETAREQQTQLQAQRDRRSAVREAILARSISLATATDQGVSRGSGARGGQANATAQGQENQQTINAGLALGGSVFQSSRDYFAATQQGNQTGSIASGISSLGGAITSNAGAITSLSRTVIDLPGSNTPQTAR